MKKIRSSKAKARLSAKASGTVAKLSSAVTFAEAAAGEDGATGPKTFSALAYSGGPVPGFTATPKLEHPYVMDLAGMEKGRSIVANLDHDRKKRVGHATEFENDGKQVALSGALSAATPHRDEVLNSASGSFPWEVSIEASMADRKFIAAGKSVSVNGRKLSGPLYVFSTSKLTGVAFVSQGADEGNTVTIAATAHGAKTMSKFDEFIVSCGADPENITDANRAQLQTAFDAIHSGGKREGKRKSVAEIAAEARLENERQDAIARLANEAMKDYPLYIDQIEGFASEAVDGKLSLDQFELMLTRNLRSKKGEFKAEASGTCKDERVIQAALCMASGLPDVEKHFSTQTLEAVDRNKMRTGYGVQSLLMQVAHSNGYQCGPGERVHQGNIRSVLEYCFPPAMARLAGFTAVSLPNILGAVANKMLLAGYVEGDQTWREIAEVKPVSNFYTQNHYRMLDSLEYAEVGSGGELTHGTLGEETYTSTAKTYGRMAALTRTQIINDDLGAFNDLRTRLGRAASKKFANIFWAAFINNSSFFTTALTNYIEGATTNLGTDGVGLGLMVKAFRQMTSPTADSLKRVGQDLNPSKILVPPELEANAMLAFRANNLDNVATSSGNIYANRFKPVVQWRLSNSSYTGYSTTAFYMFGDEVKPMLVTFLNGNESPTVESTDADFNVLGIQFRGYHDFGCDKSEYLAGIKSKGAA